MAYSTSLYSIISGYCIRRNGAVVFNTWFGVLLNPQGNEQSRRWSVFSILQYSLELPSVPLCVMLCTVPHLILGEEPLLL